MTLKRKIKVEPLCVCIHMCVYIFICMYRYESVSHLAHVCQVGIPWTVAHQAPLSVEFPRQEYWSGLSFPSPGDLPNAGTELTSI